MTGYPKKSLAAVLTEYKKPVEIKELEVPHLDSQSILVKVDAGTICGTDVHIWKGDIQFYSRIPLVMGHEAVGTIVALGSGRKKDANDQPINEGDRIVWAYPWCGNCYYCTIARQPTLCPNVRMYGWGPLSEFPHLTGGFSQYVYVKPECHVLRVPKALDGKVVSSSTCAFRTVIHGFERLRGLSTQESVLVLGAGPVGLFSLATAIDLGAHQTIVVGAPKQRLELAKRWGADHTIDLDEVSDSKQRKQMIMELTGGRGPDVVVEAAGPGQAFVDGLELVRSGGRYLVIGQADPRPVTIQATHINTRCLEIVGVLSGTIAHFHKALLFLEKNKNRFSFEEMISNTYPLDKINTALEAMGALKEIKPAILPPSD
jgi:D-arabinose 1-dehydrogenase-like Zn-dependent alcohol dehydrogenase